MIKVITNSLGQCDWIDVRGHSGTLLFSGHEMLPKDIVDMLNLLGVDTKLVEVTDEQMEDGYEG